MKKLLYILTIFLLASCASEEPQPAADQLGAPVSTALVVATTDADGVDTYENELIHSWWVAFVANGDHHIEAIVECSLDEPATDAYRKLTIPSGNYLLVAFANSLPTLSEDGETYVYQNLQFKVGAASPVISDKDHLWAELAPETWSSDQLVPMSGLQKVTVTGRSGEQIDVEVVRQVARIDFSFENVGKRPCTIHSYRLVKFKSDKVNLFPDYDQLGSTPVLPSGAQGVDVERNGLEMRLEVPEEGKTSMGYDTFYSLESVATLPTDKYTLFVNVTHHEGLGWGATTDEISAQLTNITYVNRNDIIRIPVRLTDYIISLEALFYPPIGGYPAVMTEDNSGNYYVRFGSQGVFTIRAHVRKAVALGDPDYGELSNEGLNLQITSITGDNIFTKEPELDVNHEIIGQLSPAKGQATVTVTFTIPQSDGSTLTYTRSILIIRD